jgi:uncharacterized protein YjiS (DUF1127 family)
MSDCMMKYLEQAPASEGALARLRQLLRLWRCRMQLRDELASLDARSLRDLGLSPASVEAELRKPFWRPIAIRPERDIP